MAKNAFITKAQAEQNNAVKRNENRLQPEFNACSTKLWKNADEASLRLAGGMWKHKDKRFTARGRKMRFLAAEPVVRLYARIRTRDFRNSPYKMNTQ